MTESPDLAVAFAAHVDDAGTLHVHDAGRWRVTLLARFKGKDCTVELQRPRRTNKQNSRYWGLVLPVAREVLSVGRVLPLSKEQSHAAICGAFIGHVETPLGLIPKGSRLLDTAQFAAFCEKVESHFMQEFGVTFDGEVAL